MKVLAIIIFIAIILSGCIIVRGEEKRLPTVAPTRTPITGNFKESDDFALRFSTRTINVSSTSLSSTYYFGTGIYHETPNQKLVIRTGHQTVMSVDQDGDIFLRNKWIGHDDRLKEVFKRSFR